MKRKPIAVHVYAKDDLISDFLTNFLKTKPNIIPVPPSQPADAAIIQADLLSPAEQKVLQALAKYGTVLKVAEALHYSRGTVKVYLSRIYSKLKVKTAPQAVAIAMKYGLIRLED